MRRIYFEGAFDQFDETYGKECKAELKADPKFPLVVTPKQAVVILEPVHAPENFYCDGEVSHAEALEDFKERLKMVEFNPTHVDWIIKYLNL
jgi:hypothetical protein